MYELGFKGETQTQDEKDLEIKACFGKPRRLRVWLAATIRALVAVRKVLHAAACPSDL